VRASSAFRRATGVSSVAIPSLAQLASIWVDPVGSLTTWARRHGDGVARRRAAITDVTRRELAKWPDGSMPLLPRFSDLSFAIICEVVLGLTDEGEIDRLHRLVRRATGPVALAGTWLWPLRPGRLRERAMRTVRQHQQAVDFAIVELLAKRADPVADRHDVADFLLDAVGPDSRTPDQELLEELRALLLVGHETTAAALAWAVERLVREPAVLARLEESLAAGNQSYLEGFIREVLRWRPPVIDTVRELTAPIELAGHLLEAGTLVVVAPLLVHHHPDLYSSPKEFVPERFIGTSAPHPATWIPFGGGSRRCLGAELALAELEIVLTELITSFTLEPTTARGERARLVGTVLVPARGATAVLSRRAAPIG
jgi:cytochrome P450